MNEYLAFIQFWNYGFFLSAYMNLSKAIAISNGWWDLIQWFRFEFYPETWIPKYNRPQLHFLLWILKVFLAAAVTLMFLLRNSFILKRWRIVLQSHFAPTILWMRIAIPCRIFWEAELMSKQETDESVDFFLLRAKAFVRGRLAFLSLGAPIPHPHPSLPLSFTLPFLSRHTGLEMRSKSLCFKRFGICVLATTRTIQHGFVWDRDTVWE